MPDQESYKRESIVNNWRLRKGDLDVSRDAAGYVNRASVQDNTVLSYLLGASPTFQIDRPVLDYSHLSAAATYAMWQYAFTKPFYAEPRKIYLIELLGDVQLGSDSVSAYHMLLRKIGRHTQSVVERAITLRVTPQNLAAVYEARNKFLPEFDKLLALIPEIEDELQRIKEAEKKENA